VLIIAGRSPSALRVAGGRRRRLVIGFVQILETSGEQVLTARACLCHASVLRDSGLMCEAREARVVRDVRGLLKRELEHVSARETATHALTLSAAVHGGRRGWLSTGVVVELRCG
jgi:hypothetical protein